MIPRRFQPGLKELSLERQEREAAEAEEDGEDDRPVRKDKKHGRLGHPIRPISFRWREVVSPAVLIGAFSLFALRTGAVVSYDRVNSDLAGQEPDLDGVTVLAGSAVLPAGCSADCRSRRHRPRWPTRRGRSSPPSCSWR